MQGIYLGVGLINRKYFTIGILLLSLALTCFGCLCEEPVTGQALLGPLTNAGVDVYRGDILFLKIRFFPLPPLMPQCWPMRACLRFRIMFLSRNACM
jgi:hypothetical protein